MKFKKVVIIGVGLLGGSLGLALKKNRLAGQVWGLVRSEKSRCKALRYRAVDRATLNLVEAVQGADLVVLATPVAHFTYFLGQVALAAPRNCLVTDVGSVKGPLVGEWELAARPLAFVGSHPMAGSEKTGVAEAREGLYQGAVCVTTPTKRTPRAALARVESLWKALGCRVTRLSPEAHDRKIGLVSHLPHAVAFSLIQAAAAGAEKPDWNLAGNGFKDATRIAASDPQMWADIFLANREALGGYLEKMGLELKRLARMIARRDRGALAAYLDRSARLRRGFFASGKTKRTDL